MAKDKEHEGKFELSRRDFLKAGAAAAVVGATGADMVFTASRAVAADVARYVHDHLPVLLSAVWPAGRRRCERERARHLRRLQHPRPAVAVCAPRAQARISWSTNTRRLGVPEHTALSTASTSPARHGAGREPGVAAITLDAQ